MYKRDKVLEGLNKHDAIYHGLTWDILTSPRLNFRPAERAVVDTIGVFGNQVEYDISDGSIPLLTTKPIGYKSQLVPEVVGFLRNESHLSWYLDKGMKIWTKNAFDYYRKSLPADHQWSRQNLPKDTPEFEAACDAFESLVRKDPNGVAGDLGNFYPKQWHEFESHGVVVDQIAKMVEKLRDEKASRYAIVTAWNPVDVIHGNAALAPCHCLFQGYRYRDSEGEDRLDVKMHQRSADHLLGVAFNAPQYAIITAALAAASGLKPGHFIHSFGDLHLYCGQGERSKWWQNQDNLYAFQDLLYNEGPQRAYEMLLHELPPEPNPGYDHIPFAVQQLTRQSFCDVPKLEIANPSLETLSVDDVKIIDYPRKSLDKLVIDGVSPKMAS